MLASRVESESRKFRGKLGTNDYHKFCPQKKKKTWKRKREGPNLCQQATNRATQSEDWRAITRVGGVKFCSGRLGARIIALARESGAHERVRASDRVTTMKQRARTTNNRYRAGPRHEMAAQENRWRNAKPAKIGQPKAANMTTINNPIAIVSSRSPHLPGRLAGAIMLVLALLSVVCLSNCFQNKATAAIREQLTAGQAHHLVPGARLIQATASAGTKRDHLTGGANETRSGASPGKTSNGSFQADSWKVQRRRDETFNLAPPKYVNYTSEQISRSGKWRVLYQEARGAAFLE